MVMVLFLITQVTASVITDEEMEQIKLQQLEKIKKLLTSMNCKYAIVDEDNTKHGDLEIVTIKHRTRALSEFPHGEMSRHIRNYMDYDNFTVGEVAIIPIEKFPAERIRSATCAKLSTVWGKDTYHSMINVSKNQIEVLRIA